jgi:hypothetical protein
MPHHGNCRPKNRTEQPENDNHQHDWMPDDFDQPTSGSEKNCRCSHANEQREFSAHDARGIFGTGVRFCLCRHGREHIESALVAQSANDV